VERRGSKRDDGEKSMKGLRMGGMGAGNEVL
jgi:hypothetical protein